MYKEYLQKLEKLKGTQRIELDLAKKANKLSEDLEKGNRDFMTDYMATIEYTIKKGQKELDRLGAVHRLALKTKATMEQALKDLGIKSSPILDNLDKQINKFEKSVLKQSKKYFK
tara:strand:- start:378 stop:722 length:345 start_codon:yes stop_codon:yes gene_type:complete